MNRVCRPKSWFIHVMSVRPSTGNVIGLEDTAVDRESFDSMLEPGTFASKHPRKDMD